jgi:hypothetical protein
MLGLNERGHKMTRSISFVNEAFSKKHGVVDTDKDGTLLDDIFKSGHKESKKRVLATRYIRSLRKSSQVTTKLDPKKPNRITFQINGRNSFVLTQKGKDRLTYRELTKPNESFQLKGPHYFNLFRIAQNGFNGKVRKKPYARQSPLTAKKVEHVRAMFQSIIDKTRTLKAEERIGNTKRDDLITIYTAASGVIVRLIRLGPQHFDEEVLLEMSKYFAKKPENWIKPTKALQRLETCRFAGKHKVSRTLFNTDAGMREILRTIPNDLPHKDKIIEAITLWERVRHEWFPGIIEIKGFQ